MSFSKVTMTFSSSTDNMWDFQSMISTTAYVITFWTLATLTGMEYLILDLICIALQTGDAKHLFFSH